MRHRTPDKDRCLRCRMRQSLCVCGYFRRRCLPFSTVVLMHQREIHSTTSTAQILKELIEPCEIRIHGLEGSPMRTQDLLSNKKTYVLFPSPNSVPIESVPQPEVLIIPDGSWSQASRLVRRRSELSQFTFIQITPSRKSASPVRRRKTEKEVSTLEAFANASHVWGHADVADDLLDFYDLWAQRILWSRGRISLSDCQGFIPNAAVQESLLAGRKSQKRFSKL